MGRFVVFVFFVLCTCGASVLGGCGLVGMLLQMITTTLQGSRSNWFPAVALHQRLQLCSSTRPGTSPPPAHLAPKFSKKVANPPTGAKSQSRAVHVTFPDLGSKPRCSADPTCSTQARRPSTRMDR